MSSIKGIIFDYGGTIDTNGIHWSEVIWEQYCMADSGVDKATFREAYVYGERSLAKARIIEPTDTFRTLLQKKMALQFAYLKDCSCPGRLTEECEKEIAEGCYRQVLKTIGQSRSIVNRLRERFPMVLVTNFYGNMPVVLKEFGLENIFTEIIESSVVGIRKPDSKLFALGVKALGMNAEEIAVIGDSYKKDIYPAATLGCRTIWLKSVCWEDEPIKDGHEPTFIIDNIEKLPGTIEKLV